MFSRDISNHVLDCFNDLDKTLILDESKALFRAALLKIGVHEIHRMTYLRHGRLVNVKTIMARINRP